MKKLTTRTLKILIDSTSLSSQDLVELEQWENEGGTHAATPAFLKSLAPLHRGDIFEVMSGNLHSEDDKLVFEAEIEILARR